MATLTPSPRMQFFDANGNPLVGGKLYTYLAGTTTPLATYTNSGAGTPNANPVILDSRGEASVWLGTSLYYMELKTSTDVLVWTADNIGGVATLSALAASGGSALIGFIQSGAGAVARTLQSKVREHVFVEDFGAVGDGIADDYAAIMAAIASFPLQGTPNWTPWELCFRAGKKYRVTNTIKIVDMQGGILRGNNALLTGTLANPILQLGDEAIFKGNMYFKVFDLLVENKSILAGSKGIYATGNYGCCYSGVNVYGGEYGLHLQGNANLLTNCTFRGSKLANVRCGGGPNNESNTFIACAYELSQGYGLEVTTTTAYGGTTNVIGCYWEQNALAHVRWANNTRGMIEGGYFLDMTGVVPSILLAGGIGSNNANPVLLVRDNKVTGYAASAGVFIKEESVASINCLYSNNVQVDTTLINMYGQAPRSINAARIHKIPFIQNAVSIVNTDSIGAPDGWTLGGAGNVATVAAFSPSVNGSAASIDTMNQYIYQRVNVPSGSLIRVSVYAQTTLAATAALQLLSVGLNVTYAQVSTVNAIPTKLEIYLDATQRSGAAAFIIALRNTGAGGVAQFCEIEVEDMTQ